jgi:hypothetical protein
MSDLRREMPVSTSMEDAELSSSTIVEVDSQRDFGQRLVNPESPHNRPISVISGQRIFREVRNDVNLRLMSCRS